MDLDSGMHLAPLWEICRASVFDVSSSPRTFNFYKDEDPALDLPGAAVVRRGNLYSYLEAYKESPRILLLAEAPGPWGCRFSGVPITSETQLVDAGFPLSGRQSSRRGAPLGEYSASIFWRVMGPYFPAFFVWNTVPLHPHAEGKPTSIRTPTSGEIKSFLAPLEAIITCADPERILAVGRKAEKALTMLGLKNDYIRHPSQGGATLFETGIRTAIKEMAIEPVEAASSG